MTSLDHLGRIAADAAMRGAVEYGRRHAVDFNANLDRLLHAIRKHAKAAVGPAMDDAKAALDAGMGKVAEATFLASMTAAGIAACKEVFGVGA
jgi:hypothetical protein